MVGCVSVRVVGCERACGGVCVCEVERVRDGV